MNKPISVPYNTRLEIALAAHVSLGSVTKRCRGGSIRGRSGDRLEAELKKRGLVDDGYLDPVSIHRYGFPNAEYPNNPMFDMLIDKEKEKISEAYKLIENSHWMRQREEAT